MPSSRTDRDALAATLRTLTSGWDAALEAVLQGDLDRVGTVLAQNGALLAAPPPHAPGASANDAELERLHRDATAAHARLAAVLRAAQDAVATELGKVRNGRRALGGYAGQAPRLGDRCQSRA